MLTRNDAVELGLAYATDLMSGKRFRDLAETLGDVAAAERVVEVADVFIARLRRLAGVRLVLVAIEEQDGSATYPPPPEGTMTNIDSSQRARYVIEAIDDRNFPVDATLAARSSDEAVVTVEIIEATAGTASGKDELVATFAGLGTATIEIYDPANPDVALAADVIVANPGGVAAASLGTPVIEEIPGPPPVE